VAWFFAVFKDDDNPHEVCAVIQTCMKNSGNLMLDNQLLQFVMKMRRDFEDLIPKLYICAEHSCAIHRFTVRNYPAYKQYRRLTQIRRCMT
jgi:cytidylate kinase